MDILGIWIGKQVNTKTGNSKVESQRDKMAYNPQKFPANIDGVAKYVGNISFSSR